MTEGGGSCLGVLSINLCRRAAGEGRTLTFMAELAVPGRPPAGTLGKGPIGGGLGGGMS